MAIIDSLSKGALDGLEALPNDGVVTDVEYLAATRLDQQTGSVDEPITRRMNGLKRPDHPPFAIRAAPLRGTDLLGAYQVECDDAEHQPSATWVMTLCRQAIERESALKLTVHPLVGAAPAHEEPYRPPGHFPTCLVPPLLRKPCLFSLYTK